MTQRNLVERIFKTWRAAGQFAAYSREDNRMDTVITTTVGDVLIGLLIIAGVILIVFLTIAAYNLIKTLKHTQKVLEDLEVVVRVASKRTKELDKFIDKLSKSFKAGQGVLGFIPIIFKAIAKIAKAVGQQQNKNAENDKE